MTAFTRSALPFVVKASVATADSAADIRVSTDGTVNIDDLNVPGVITVSVVDAAVDNEAVTATGYIAIADQAGTTWYVAAYTSVW